MHPSLPTTIETERLLLRTWQPSDAPRLKAAIDANLTHLQAWLPWAMTEPSPPDVIVERIDKFAADFTAGIDWAYGMFSLEDDIVLGGAGAHYRSGDDWIEIGYWTDATHTRKGYATEAAAGLTRAAFTQPMLARVQIRCDPNNVASAGIPNRLGFRHVETLLCDGVTPAGAPRDTMVWELIRTEFESRGGTQFPDYGIRE